jgi:protein-L-isoaspartate(D-aspartate) O-methyltransferase
LPIGGDRHSQRLVRITRRDADRFDEEPLCAVRFVPLIGAQAWPDRATFDRQGD